MKMLAVVKNLDEVTLVPSLQSNCPLVLFAEDFAKLIDFT